MKRKRILCPICKAIEEKHSDQKNETMVVDTVSGIWKDRHGDVDNYIREMRTSKRRKVLSLKHYPKLQSYNFI